MCLQHEGALVKTDCCNANTNEPRALPTNTDVNTLISTVASGWRTFAILQPFVEMSNFPSTTTQQRLALPVIWTPSFGGNTTKHITQRNTSPTSQEQIRNPVECTFRCCPALILLMPPGFATLRQTTRTTHHQLSKTTHSITDIRPVTYVQRMRLAKHGRHLSVAHHQDNTTASDKKHTQCTICENMLRVVAATRFRIWFPQITMSTTHVRTIHAHV